MLLLSFPMNVTKNNECLATVTDLLHWVDLLAFTRHIVNNYMGNLVLQKPGEIE